MLFTFLVLAAALLATAPTVTAAELWIGSATADITPKDTKLAITGNRTVRLSDKILSPCLVNVLALESREGDNHGDQVIIVACDLCVIRRGIQDGFRKVVAERLPGFDVNNLFLSATHTHTAPVLLQDRYESYGDAMQPKDYVDYGVQIQARSPAQQTFLIQLAAPLDFAYYVPTPRAVAGGGYSAEVTHNLVGPDGAEVLVERTIESISNLFPPAK